MKSISQFFFLTFLLAIISLPIASYASDDPRINYQSYVDISPAPSTIPTVVAVPLPADANKVLVYEVNTDTYLDSLIENKIIDDGIYYTIQSLQPTGLRGNSSVLLDNNPNTAVDLIIEGETLEATTDFIINSNLSKSVSELVINYAPNTVMPNSVTLYAQNLDGSEELVIRRNASGSTQIIQFPERMGKAWRLNFSYEQPVRITGLQFGPVKRSSIVDSVHFLAQPNQNYRAYLYPEKYVYTPLRSSGDLVKVSAYPPAYLSGLQSNPIYTLSDIDQDGLPDEIDNCPGNYNPDQISTRANGLGDVCDDFDNDYVINSLDNCQFLPNTNQADKDADGIGDVCDESESRLTEQYPWLPWVGMGITVLVIITLFISVARRPLPTEEEKAEDTNVV